MSDSRYRPVMPLTPLTEILSGHPSSLLGLHTTEARDALALTNIVVGTVIYNSTLACFQVWCGSLWSSIDDDKNDISEFPL